MKIQLKIAAAVLTCLSIGACQTPSKNKRTLSSEEAVARGEALIKYDYKPGEILQLTDDAIKKHEAGVAQILAIPDNKKNFFNTIAQFDRIGSELDQEASPINFMKDVSRDEGLRKEGGKSEEKVGQYAVSIGTRKDIYQAVLTAYKNTPKDKLTPEDKRLAEETIKGFKRNGLNLPDQKLEEVKKLQNKLVELSTAFSENYNEAKARLEFTAADLEGLPESVMSRLEKVGDKYIVTVKSTDYVPVMENCVKSETRRKMQIAYENRAADKNIDILKEVLGIREKLATLLGYKTWADYKIEDRMAKTSKNVWEFLNGLKDKLAERNQKDMEAMLKYKKKFDPKATKLDPWDPRFFENQIRKNELKLDSEVIKEYFPADQTVAKMFDIYSQLLGLKFVQIKDAQVWSPDVRLYQIRNANDNSFVGHFFADFVPREGKYNHAAAFTLIGGRLGEDGKYVHPVSAIVANFAPPANGKPSLLTHDEVETLFHEFGHIMHQTLTKANYGGLAGTSVARDFVEAPSQMLENWVWDKEMLKKISGHYKDPSQKLPDDIINRLIASRNLNKGYFYTRQLVFGIYDMTLHSSTALIEDPTAVYKKIFKEVAHMDPLPETNFPASFGHLMGYDAGYYGYLWSLVFADDMFTLFEKDGLLSSKIGRRYRKNILEKGNTYPADKLLLKFLGRKPNNKAFLKKLMDTSCINTLSKLCS